MRWSRSSSSAGRCREQPSGCCGTDETEFRAYGIANLNVGWPTSPRHALPHRFDLKGLHCHAGHDRRRRGPARSGHAGHRVSARTGAAGRGSARDHHHAALPLAHQRPLRRLLSRLRAGRRRLDALDCRSSPRCRSSRDQASCGPTATAAFRSPGRCWPRCWGRRSTTPWRRESSNRLAWSEPASARTTPSVGRVPWGTFRPGRTATNTWSPAILPAQPASGRGHRSRHAADLLRFARMHLNGGEIDGRRVLSAAAAGRDAARHKHEPVAGPTPGASVGTSGRLVDPRSSAMGIDQRLRVAPNADPGAADGHRRADQQWTWQCRLSRYRALAAGARLRSA